MNATSFHHYYIETITGGKRLSSIVSLFVHETAFFAGCFEAAARYATAAVQDQAPHPNRKKKLPILTAASGNAVLSSVLLFYSLHTVLWRQMP